MSATTIKCPEGHLNPQTQRFCGECGVSLVGVCPNGHPNPESQRYCGECGSPMWGMGGVDRLMEQDTTVPETTPIEQDAESSVPASSEEASVLATTGNWFGRQSPKVQTLISAALVVPAAILASLRGSPGLFIVSVICYLAVLAVVARSHHRRNTALLVAGIAGAIGVAAGLLMPLVETRSPEPDPPIEIFLAVIVLGSPLGLVAAWSIARRNRSGRWIGLLLAAPFGFFAGALAVRGLARDLEFTPFQWMATWGIQTILGSAVAWGVDLATRRLRRNQPPATTVRSA